MIERRHHLERVETLLRQFPVVAIVGPRQTGKTTLARQVLGRAKKGTVFDLEDPRDLAQLDEPSLALEPLRGLVVIDEVQRRPDLFPLLRVLADRRPRPARFLLLGSASPDLTTHSSESLAGRIAYHTLPGLSLEEVGAKNLEKLWLRGGFPDSFRARSHTGSFTWRRNFVRTFVERDIPQLSLEIPAAIAPRFWSMLAHYHAQTWNSSELGRALGVTDKTARRYLDALTHAQVVTQLRPWFANTAKRQVKAPKIYVTDSGLTHSLLDIRDRRDLMGHPKVGASWEGFLLGQTLQLLRAEPDESHFWATHTGAELDLLFRRARRRWGFEFKRTAAPRFTKSMASAFETLGLQKLHVVHAGDRSFPLRKNVMAVAASDLVELLL